MKRRQGSVIVVVIIIIALMAIGGLTYYALRPKPPQPSPSVSVTPSNSVAPIPTAISISKNEYSITIPKNWKEVVPTQANTAEKVNRFESDDNYYLVVEVNPAGRGYNADTSWGYSIQPDASLQLINEQTDCKPADDIGGFCSAGDGKLDIGIGVDGSYQGKRYFMFVGNTKDEAASRQILKDTIATIRLK